MADQAGVYLMRNKWHKDSVYKIGCTTRNADVRAHEINRGETGTPGGLVPVEFYPCDDDYGLEQRLHGHFKAVRCDTRREFFEVTPEEVTEVVESWGINPREGGYIHQEARKAEEKQKADQEFLVTRIHGDLSFLLYMESKNPEWRSGKAKHKYIYYGFSRYLNPACKNIEHHREMMGIPPELDPKDYHKTDRGIEAASHSVTYEDMERITTRDGQKGSRYEKAYWETLKRKAAEKRAEACDTPKPTVDWSITEEQRAEQIQGESKVVRMVAFAILYAIVITLVGSTVNALASLPETCIIVGVMITIAVTHTLKGVRYDT